MTERVLLLLIPITVSLWSNENYWWGHCFGRWAILLAGLSIYVSWLCARNTHWSLFPFSAYTLLSGLWVFAWRDNQYLGWQLTDKLVISKESTYSTFVFLLMLVFVALFKRRHIKTLIKSIAMICLMSIVYTIYQYDLPVIQRGALSGNGSINGCLIAITLPFLAFRLWDTTRWLSLLLCLLASVAIYLTQTSVPIGVLGVVITVFLVMKHRKWWGFTVFIPLFGMGYWLQGATFFNSSNRFSMWIKFMSWWKDNQSVWFGAGKGTSISLLPYIQGQFGSTTGWFIWLHNDWLQTIFEQGYIGFILLLLPVSYAVIKTRNNPWLASSITGFASASLFDYPCRLPLTMFAGIAMIIITFKGGGEINGLCRKKR